MTRQPRPFASLPALEQLADDSPCLAAVFCSYTFDPAFFENHVLRTVLKLRSDPEEHATDYLNEATRELQTAPIACFVDAGARTPGQRLPYELHLVAKRVFHPKLALIARPDHARMLLGSGNLTRGGYGDNSELWTTLRLEYGSAADAALLRDLLAALRDVAALAGHPSPALAELERVISVRLLSAQHSPPPPSWRFLHSLHRPLLPAFLELLPPDATIVQVGVLAPFYEREDPDALSHEDVDGVLAVILGSRPSAGAALDMGFGWDGGPLSPPTTIPPLTDHASGIWVHRIAGTPPSLEYFTPHKWTPKSLRYSDSKGIAHTRPREEAEHAWNTRAVFPAAPLRANGPQQIVQRLRDRHVLRTWLYPSFRLEAGRPVKRPLHAKLLAVCVATPAGETTYLLLGSPNASRRALLIPGAQSNVEFALAMAYPGRRTLDDLAPQLVACPPDQLVLTTPDFPRPADVVTRWIDAVEYDAQTRDLRVSWAPGAEASTAYRLLYRDDLLAAGPAVPSGLQIFADFELHPTSCELLLELGADTYSFPILVLNLAALQVDPVAIKYDLAALIALLSRRISAARLGQLILAQSTDGTAELLLATLFGEGFTPTDVFRMFHALARELAEPTHSLPAFRHVLQRPTGVLAVWDALHGALGVHLSREQLWFYGSELVRSLSRLALPDDADRADKASELAPLIARLRRELGEFTPSAAEHPWVEEMVKFYG